MWDPLDILDQNRSARTRFAPVPLRCESKSVPLIALAVGLMEPFDAKHACRNDGKVLFRMTVDHGNFCADFLHFSKLWASNIILETFITS
jgi:hypothetical protein